MTLFDDGQSLPTRKRASPGAVSQPTETDALLSGTSDDFVTTSVVSEAATTPEEPLGFLALLRISKVYHVVWSYFLIVLVSLSFEAIFPVWYVRLFTCSDRCLSLKRTCQVLFFSASRRSRLDASPDIYLSRSTFLSLLHTETMVLKRLLSRSLAQGRHLSRRLPHPLPVSHPQVRD